ncbi:MAG: acetyl-CoA hydrolase/transferase C-terminal domain-containing protein [Rhodospirillales bacterium]
MPAPGTAIPELKPDQLDLARLIRAGDSVLWGQGTAEPLTLTEALVGQRAAIGHIDVFIGPSWSPTLQPEHADVLSLKSYCAIGNNRRLAKAGALEIVPCHYSKIPGLVADGGIACDVVFLQLSAENANGEFSLGLANDYLLDATRRARVVIAEINDRLPWTHANGELKDLRIDYLLRSSRPPLDAPALRTGEVERRIAAYASAFIGDGAVLEMGIGAIPDAIIASLADRRDLGIHSGILGDSAVDLIESGAVTNARKRVAPGVSIAGLLFGSGKLYEFADRNPALRLCPAAVTHGTAVLAQLDGLVAINSAIEVDLTGQVNAEVLGHEYIGAVGGQGDFVRGAGLARGHRRPALDRARPIRYRA